MEPENGDLETEKTSTDHQCLVPCWFFGGLCISIICEEYVVFYSLSSLETFGPTHLLHSDFEDNNLKSISCVCEFSIDLKTASTSTMGFTPFLSNDGLES